MRGRLKKIISILSVLDLFDYLTTSEKGRLVMNSDVYAHCSKVFTAISISPERTEDDAGIDDNDHTNYLS